jgi:sugar/nucleoside kinase (ribokinase family)
VGELATLRDARWMLDAARARGITVSLDVAWDDAVFRDRDAFALATSVDLILPNASEAAALTGLPADDADALLRTFADRGPAIALKLGAAGAAFSDGRTFVRAESLPGPVVDATGAGDAFSAGFLDAWIDLAPAPVCLARAVACGSHAVRHAGGARTLPDRATIDALARLVTFPLAATSVALGA